MKIVVVSDHAGCGLTQALADALSPEVSAAGRPRALEAAD